MENCITPSRKDVTAFAHAYATRLRKTKKYRGSFFNGRPPYESPNWDYFIKAKTKAIASQAMDEPWIESQFFYFEKFGHIPKPFHLCTELAEERFRAFRRAFLLIESIGEDEEQKMLERLMRTWDMTEEEVIEKFGGDQGLFSKEFVRRNDESN